MTYTFVLLQPPAPADGQIGTEREQREEPQTHVNVAVQHYELTEHLRSTHSADCSKADGISANGQPLGQFVIKKFRDPFAEPNYDRAKHVFRELALLHLMANPNSINLIGLFDVILPPGVRSVDDVSAFAELSVVTKFCGRTLQDLLRDTFGSGQRLNLDQIGNFSFQILCGLHYLHKSGVIHRDLKIDNIVYDKRGIFKIIDYGMARSEQFEQKMTPFVGHMFYQAPELLLGVRSYDPKADLWSLGCILAEMLLGERLFDGERFQGQWTKLVGVLGWTDLAFLGEEQRTQISREKLGFVLSVERKQPAEWEQVLPDNLFPTVNDAETTRDLLSQLIVFDPKQRLSAEAALRHPFYASNLNCDRRLIVEPTVHYDFHQEMGVHSIDEWKAKILHKVDEIRADFAA